MKKLFNFLTVKATERWFFRGIIGIVEKLLLGILTVLEYIVKFIFWVLEFPFRGLDYLFAYPVRKHVAKANPCKRQVMFMTFQGDYTCNPKYIAEEMIRQNVDATLIWDVKTDIINCDYPMNLKLVKHDTYEFYKAMAESKVLIENTNIVERLGAYKKKDQYLLQTWHGSLGIKRLDGDVVMGWSWKRLAKKCKKSVDYLLTDSDFEKQVFEEAYWGNTPEIREGHARNDVFFYDENDPRRIEARKRVYKYLGIPEDKKIFLFAPTHRDDVEESFHSFNYGAVRDALHDRFGGDWQIVLRFHNRLRRASRDWMRVMPDYVSDATMYGDMQELLMCTEVGVTDYSSWIFDYVLGRKPGFIVEMGLDEYEKSRGFYYPLESTPFPVADDFVGLCDRIREFDADKYDKDIDTFLEARGCMEDGHAAEGIVREIKKMLDEVQ